MNIWKLKIFLMSSQMIKRTNVCLLNCPYSFCIKMISQKTGRVRRTALFYKHIVVMCILHFATKLLVHLLSFPGAFGSISQPASGLHPYTSCHITHFPHLPLFPHLWWQLYKLLPLIKMERRSWKHSKNHRKWTWRFRYFERKQCTFMLSSKPSLLPRCASPHLKI